MSFKDAVKTFRAVADAAIEIEAAATALEEEKKGGEKSLAALNREIAKATQDLVTRKQQLADVEAEGGRARGARNEEQAQLDRVRAERKDEDAKLEAARTSLSVLKASVSNLK